MTLKIYVSKDSKGREWAPDTAHEVRASGGDCKFGLKLPGFIANILGLIVRVREVGSSNLPAPTENDTAFDKAVSHY